MTSVKMMAMMACALALLAGDAQGQTQCTNHDGCNATEYCDNLNVCDDCATCIVVQDAFDGGNCPSKCGFNADCLTKIRLRQDDLPDGCPCIKVLGFVGFHDQTESYCKSNACDDKVTIGSKTWATCSEFDCDAGCVVGVIIGIMCCCGLCAGCVFFFFIIAKGNNSPHNANYQGGVNTVPATAGAYSENHQAAPPAYPQAQGGAYGNQAPPPAYPQSDPMVF